MARLPDPSGIPPAVKTSGSQSRAKSEPFLMLPVSMIRRVDLTPGAKILWATLRDYARIHGNGVAWPGQRRLREDLGVKGWPLDRWTAELVKAGLLQVESGKGKRPNHYRPVDPPDGDDGESCSAPKGQEHQTVAPLGTQEPRSAPRSAPLAPRKTPRSAPKGRNHNINQKNQTVGVGAAAPPTAADFQNENGEEEKSPEQSPEDIKRIEANIGALMLVGIGKPTRGRLAREPGVTPQIIGAVHASGLRAGLLVREIESRAEQAVACAAAGIQNPNARYRPGRVEAPPGKYANVPIRGMSANPEPANPEPGEPVAVQHVDYEQRRRELAEEKVAKHTDEECEAAWAVYIGRQIPSVRALFADGYKKHLTLLAEELEPGCLEKPTLEYGELRPVEAVAV